ncbi:MAG: hypothetical protein R2828_33285 [Saprospiraceae bacterium]
MKNYFSVFTLFLKFFLAFSLLGGQVLIAQADAQEVKTSIYIINIYDLDINQHSFYVDCYISFKWKGDRDPMNIEFVNSVEKWGATIEPFYEEAITTEDGYQYNGMRYEGRFYHPFQLERFPLDQHLLDIQIENVDYPIDSLVYIADTNATFIREEFHLPGWNILGTSTSSEQHVYPINFGEMGKEKTTFSNFIFQFGLRRPLNYFLLKLLLPLLIVVVASLGALLIHPSNIDARISLPIGGLLSAVFLQQSYSSALPDVGYMVLMDKIYLLVYMLIASIMLRVVLSGNTIAKLKKATDIQQIKRRDTYLILLLLALLAIGISILVF